MNTIISKDTISRLLKDVKHIFKNPLTENGGDILGRGGLA
jgi:hypothetical protein